MAQLTTQPLAEIEESLKSALPWLEQAYSLMNANRLDTQYSKLYVAICDAMTATQVACESLEDMPDDQPEATATDLEALMSLVD
jgi:hypothetical protein